MKQYIVDRFEENFVVLEMKEGGTVDIEKQLLPNAKKGDVVVFENGVYRTDEKLTLERKARISEKMKKLFAKE